MTPRVCSVEGCGRPHMARSLCGLHYKRERRSAGFKPRSRPEGISKEEHEKNVARRGHIKALGKYPAVDGLKTCACCKNTLTVVLFGRNKTSPDGLSMRCKLCRGVENRRLDLRKGRNEYAKKHRKVKPHLHRSRHLRYEHGMSVTQYNELLIFQGGACAICRAKNVDKPRHRLMVDHCHETGVTRGLLCRKCNFALGLLRDDVQLLIKASTYLMRSRLTGEGRKNVDDYIKANRKPYQPRLPL